jgi:hypothetical protein
MRKEIGKDRLIDLSDELFQAYLKEQRDARTWETQVEMILALGLLDCKHSLPEIELIVRANNPEDMITYVASQTYVRLKRQTKDGTPCIELLKFGRLSVIHGCLDPLGYDKMVPPIDQIKELIRLGWDLHKHKDRLGQEYGLSDPRYGLAAACAGWDKELTKEFLKHCVLTGDAPVKYAAEHSLKGKYVRLR